MSGTLRVRAGLVWGAANWCHDAVLRRLAAELEPADPVLAAAMLDAQVEVRGYASGDLEQLSAARFVVLLGAVRRAYEQTVEQGPGAFAKPEFWPGCMERFSELTAMLRTDPRAGEPPDLIGTVVSPHGAERLPAWGYDLELEQLAANAQPLDASLAADLLAARTGLGSGQWHLAQVGRDRWALLHDHAERLAAHYAEYANDIGERRPGSPQATFLQQAAEVYARTLGLLAKMYRAPPRP